MVVGICSGMGSVRVVYDGCADKFWYVGTVGVAYDGCAGMLWHEDSRNFQTLRI